MRFKNQYIIHLLSISICISGFGDLLDSNVPILRHVMEDCSNAIDDDADGLIDLNDPDCICEVLKPESLIPNPSFEERTCCPEERSRLYCAEGWIQASDATTDLIHPCGWTGWNGHFPPTPFPDGESIIGFANGRVSPFGAEYNWKEYTGACLSTPLKANTTYRFEFSIGFTNEQLSPAIDISFFGTTSCDNLPFGVGDPDFGCPTNGPNWKLLGYQDVGGGGGSAWVKTEITITPTEDIHAIAIGPPCAASGASNTTYYFFDNLVLADIRSFEFKISEVDHPCSADFTLRVPEEEGINYQWYKEGIALVGEESSLLSMNYGEGDYQVRIESEGSCLLTQLYSHIVPVFSDTTLLTICNDETYQFGDALLTESGEYMESFKSKNNCDSTVALTLVILPELEESVSAKIFEGETYEEVDDHNFNAPGNYEVTLTNDIGCDSLVILDLEFYNVYFPNIFNPNSDGNNNQFKIFGNSDISEIKSLDIYDRWGMLVYHGTYESQHNDIGWDGKVNGKLVEQGIYSYISKLKMDDGKLREFVGSFLLVK